MPELDFFLDELVADVTARSSAPGATLAIKRSRRQRARLVAAGALAASVAAVGLGGALLPDERDPQPAPAPSLPPPTESGDSFSARDAAFETELREIVAQVPGWSIEDRQPTFVRTPCAGDWSARAVGAGGGSFEVSTNGVTGQVWHERVGFASSADAAAAMESLVDNLESCTTVAWQGRGIDRTGAVLASSEAGLVWVHHADQGLSLLEAATTDGPPPPDIQRAIADLLRSDSTE